ncbi:MAG: ATPase [Hyphomicrobiales bacterium]|nr:ATPase [Hyphomicrobiales bacterium]
MADDLSSQIFIGADERDPLRAVQKDGRAALPKRFYKSVAVAGRDGAFAILLDDKPVRTPAGNAFALPTERAADLVSAEWRAQGEHIDPAAMPVTRLVNSGLDGVARDPQAVAADIVKYSASDLVCYRAGEPASLVDAQNTAWNPAIVFARERYGARFALGEGVMFVTQDDEAIHAIARAVAQVAPTPLKLAALHSMTTLTGSALLALMVAGGALDAEGAWTAAHVDEDHQMRLWGSDAEALARRSARFRDMQAAAALFAAL